MGLPESLFAERLVLPSVLSADFSCLADQVLRVIKAGARLLHIDVMDGHFVPNLTIGAPVVRSLAPVVHSQGAFLDVHLMIEQPERYIDDFAEAGADALSVHIETCPHIQRTLVSIRERGLSAGLVLNPGTALATIEEALLFADYLLVMSVNPGFGGQAFIPESLAKLRRACRLVPPGMPLEVDGGVGRETVESVGDAGARWLVAGSAVFGAPDPATEYRHLEHLAWGSRE